MQTDISKKRMDTIFDSADENKEVSKKHNEIWRGIKSKIKTINDNKENDQGKVYIKIKLNFDDDLPLNKPLKFHAMTIIIRSVFKEDGKLYPQIFLDDSFYECTYKCQNMIELIFQKELMLIKQVRQKNVIFVTVGISKILDLSLNHIFAMVVVI